MSNFLIHNPQCVFIHIPRTGGMSIRRGVFAGDYTGPYFGSFPPEWYCLFKFGFVRNPFDRLVSAWQLLTVGSDYLRTSDPRPAMSLRQFLEIATDESITYEISARTFECFVRHHTIPQTHPFNCLDEADFIGRFETLERDFQLLCDNLGIAQRLPHLNRTSHREYRAYFDAETRSIAERFYHDDLERLGYHF